MMIGKTKELTRRAFFNRVGALAAAGVAAPIAMNLASVGEAAAFTGSDYKALVCVFLQGGNDHANTLIPYDDLNYSRYSAIRGGGPGQTRGGIAYGKNELSGTILTPRVQQNLTDDITYALSPSLPDLSALFGLGRLAVQLNVGPLQTPLTLPQYNGSNRTSYPLPPQLFSHNDQQSVWQAMAMEGATVGWGGKLGDLALAGNSNSMLTCISASGNAVFLSGTNALQYQIAPTGAIAIKGTTAPLFGSSACQNAFNTLISQTSANIFEDEYAKVTRRSAELQSVVNNALAPVSLNTTFTSSNSLASQLKAVAKLIAARDTLGLKRQVFFVTLNGFDSHDDLMTMHPAALTKLNDAMLSFYKATVELGVADKVTTFTASEFGRTLTSNGDGSDHGWGGHQFIMGGAVRGGQFYGTAPHVSLTADDQVGQGRLLPTTSVDQMAATLARWFGVADSEMSSIFPNIGRFGTSNLGFMTA